MDISCIISSGDLELYVLGMLSQEENEKIAQLANMFPEIKREIDEIEQSLINMDDSADANSVPSASVKTDLFAKLHQLKLQESENLHTEFTVAPSMASASQREETKVIPLHQPKRNNQWLAASVIGLLACLWYHWLSRNV